MNEVVVLSKDELIEILRQFELVPLNIIKSEFERLHRRIDELEAKLVIHPKSPKHNVKYFLTKKEVAEKFSISKTTLWRLEKEGELVPARKTKGAKGHTGKVVYLREDVEAYFKGKNLD